MELPAKLTKKQQNFVDLMSNLGIDRDSEEFQNAWREYSMSAKRGVPDTTALAAAQRTAAAFREAEFVSKFIDNRITEAYSRVCRNCRQIFISSYAYQAHCCLDCLKATLDVAGIPWNPEKTEEERWGGVPPSVISPATLSALRKIIAFATGEGLVTGVSSEKVDHQDISNTSLLFENTSISSTDTSLTKSLEDELDDLLA